MARRAAVTSGTHRGRTSQQATRPRRPPCDRPLLTWRPVRRTMHRAIRRTAGRWPGRAVPRPAAGSGRCRSPRPPPLRRDRSRQDRSGPPRGGRVAHQPRPVGRCADRLGRMAIPDGGHRFRRGLPQVDEFGPVRDGRECRRQVRRGRQHHRVIGTYPALRGRFHPLSMARCLVCCLSSCWLPLLPCWSGSSLVAIGRGGELAFFEADYAPLKLDEVSATDVVLFRPPTALWGYSMQATDEALNRIAAAITERDIEISALQPAGGRSGGVQPPGAAPTGRRPSLRRRPRPPAAATRGPTRSRTCAGPSRTRPLPTSGPAASPASGPALWPGRAGRTAARPGIRPRNPGSEPPAAPGDTGSTSKWAALPQRPPPTAGTGRQGRRSGRPVTDKAAARCRARTGRLRCPWGLSAPEYLGYHDEEWGRPIHDDTGMFQRLCLEGFQSGLSWLIDLAQAGELPRRVRRLPDRDGGGLRRRRRGQADGRRRDRTQPRQGQRGHQQRQGRPRPARRAGRTGLGVRAGGPGRQGRPRGPWTSCPRPRPSRRHCPASSSGGASRSPGR